MIWKNELTAEQINHRYGHTKHIGSLLDIRFTEIGDDFIKATMPVDERTHQPYGLLHGGASVVLAETLGSVASALCVDPTKYDCVGLEVNANHLRAVRSGLVTGVCSPIKLGATVHVWEIKIYNEQGKMNCLSRLTVMVVPKGKV
ncbi:hotdog fold thioesterase [Solitalea sp. MAHUQ-68]|uniref:Hotdog fold thioesterase n=1 Tax=Solitalea agri TaxID=2953739 RepID=A0A9X2F1M0_9SPHI|nr:hotdog fold thioesterase [Solitalea agri]MCO4292992.1 hotdog fold thioesterase [Solitalea agri]